MTCPICLEEITDDPFTTHCNHKFHTKCIKTWLITPKYTCPMCVSFISHLNIISEKDINMFTRNAIQIQSISNGSNGLNQSNGPNGLNQPNGPNILNQRPRENILQLLSYINTPRPSREQIYCSPEQSYDRNPFKI
jgi:hypothetical protein